MLLQIFVWANQRHLQTCYLICGNILGQSVSVAVTIIEGYNCGGSKGFEYYQLRMDDTMSWSEDEIDWDEVCVEWLLPTTIASVSTGLYSNLSLVEW